MSLGSVFILEGAVFTISSLILLGFSLQSLSQELLLLGQVLLDKAILAHLLAHLHTQTNTQNNNINKRSDVKMDKRHRIYVYLGIRLQPTVRGG